MEWAFTKEIEGIEIHVGSFFFIYWDVKFNFVCVYQNTKKWDFIVDIEFLCKVKNGVILKSLFYYIDFIELSVKRSMSSAYLK